MILILTQQFDTHADKVIAELAKQGVPFFRLNVEDMPQAATATLRFGGEAHDLSIVSDGKRLELETVTAVWNRRMRPPAMPVALEPNAKEFAIRETNQMIRSMWYLTRDKTWINDYVNAIAAEHKPFQLANAQAVGWTIPATIITNNVSDALLFYDQCNGRVIYKPFGGYGITVEEQRRQIFTTVISRSHLERSESQMALGPGIFQEYVEKSMELRVTVFDNEMFATEIHSQGSVKAALDWRRYDFDNTPHKGHVLSAITINKVRRLMKRLGLVFGCIDLIVTPDGDEVFLEVNQSGQWYWIEGLTGQPLLAAFTSMLMAAAKPVHV